MSENVSQDSLEFAVTQTQADGHLNVVTLDVPNTDVLFFGRNTRLPAIAERNSELKNSLFLYYDRVDIAAAFAPYEDNVELPLNGATTTHGLIPQINAKYHVTLVPEDVVLATLTGNNITITITPTSLAWYGTYDFTATVPMSVEVLENITATTAAVIANDVATTQDVTRFIWPFVFRTQDGFLLNDKSSNFLTVRE